MSVQVLQSEASLLHGIIAEAPHVLPACLDAGLRPEHFEASQHQAIYRAARDRWLRGDGVDFLLLTGELGNTGTMADAGGLDYLNELLDAEAAIVSPEDYARTIRDAALRRGIAQACRETIKDLNDPKGRDGGQLLDDAETRLLALGGETRSRDGGRAGDAVPDVLDRLERRKRGETTGLGTGFPDLDRKTSGLQNGQLVIVAGRPSMGKTAWATEVAADNALHRNVSTAIYSLEQSREELVGRILSGEARVDLHAPHHDGDRKRLETAAERIKQAPLFIFDRPFRTVLSLRAHARRVHHREKLRLLVVDYLQLMGGDGASRNEEVSQISRGLKALARELDVPVIALSQLSRACEQRQNKRPILSDLRDSGSLEQDADIVLFLFRPEYYLSDTEALTNGLRGHAELIVAKQRNGPTGTIPLYFEKAFTRFDSVEKQRAA